MVSLGPLNDRSHCPYRCAFCYVQDGFVSYANLNLEEILEFLIVHRDKYNIVYVSGDTDSFAPPRTMQGLELLYKIAIEIDCDLLFTTRAKFSEEHYKLLRSICAEQERTGNMLYACVSISRLFDETAYLEPKPIPTPIERIEVLKQLKIIGATTVLAIRPFLPVVSVQDYLEIIERSKEFVDIVLGECFYFIRGGAIEKRVFPNGISPTYEKDIKQNQKMPFDDNNADWDIWESAEYESAVRKKCEQLGIVFSMHSDDAIQMFLQRKE